MDIIFWNGGITVWPVFSRSIGPYKLRHWMNKHGYDCQVIDHVTVMTQQQLLAATEKFITPNTLMIGISTTFICENEYTHEDGSVHRVPEHLLAVIKELKQSYPHIKIVVGGYMSEKISFHGLVDATVMSYTTATEDVFLEYVDHLRTGSLPPQGQVQPTWEGYSRIVYHKANNPKYNIETDDFRFVPQDVILPGEVLPLDVSRGCIFACKFCNYPHLGKKKLDYIRGMNYIQEELAYNKETFGTTRYLMLDDTFNDTEYKMQEFWRMTQNLDFDIEYSAYIRADLVHRFPDMAHWLQDSGLVGAFHGIESLHEEASKLVGKGWSGKHGKEYLPRLYHDIWNKQVTQHLSFIVGLPREPAQHLVETMNWFMQNDMGSCNFMRLRLWGPGDYRLFTTESEFDKNSHKYGFEFTGEPSGDGGWRPWKNDCWTLEQAEQMSFQLNAHVSRMKKEHCFNVITLLGYGLSLDTLLNKPSKELPWPRIKARTRSMYQDYYNRLMAL